MKAAILTSYGDAKKAFTIKEVSKPSALSSDEVLIKVEAFGLNFADVMARRGMYNDAPPLPAILGYDIVGQVIESGSEKGKSLLGKRVVAMTRFGGYAEYAKTKISGVVEIGNQMEAYKASALATQYCTAYYGACETTNLFEGDKVLLHAAAGGVGTAITQLAKLKGCKVFGITSRESKVDYLLKNGVDVPIVAKNGNYHQQLEKELGNDMLDVVFNSVGGATYKKDLGLLNKGGKIILYGVADRLSMKKGMFGTLQLVWKFGLMSPIQVLINSQSIIGINMLRIADHQPNTLKRCLEKVVEMTLDGSLNPKDGGAYSVNDIDQAHEHLESRNSVGKITVNW